MTTTNLSSKKYTKMAVCTDGGPHNFILVPQKPDWVYCGKCLETDQLIYNSDPPPNPTPDPRPVVTFQASGGDDTNSLQNWLNQQPSNAIYDIKGIAGINNKGIRITLKANVKITSSNGGGFKAISDGLYQTPFSSMIYAETFNGGSFDTLKFNCNNKKVQGVYILRSSQAKVINCEIWGVARDPSGSPWAAVYGEQNSDVEIGGCFVHNTEYGVRGIWFGVGDRHDTRPHIHHNTVRDTGHTGIVTESTAPNVHHNYVNRGPGDGTGYKFIARAAPAEAIWDDNSVENTEAGGFMIEGSPVKPPKIFIRRWTAKNCGKQGTSFGFIYVSSDQGVSNLEISDCKLEGCKSVGAALFLTNSNLTNNQIISGSNSFNFEQDCNNIHMTNSGVAGIGNRVTNIWVDGQKVA